MKTLKELIEKIESHPLERFGHIYHPIPFPEFEHLKVSSNEKEVYKKWGIILQTSRKIFGGNFSRINILDVGGNAGFYSFNFAKLGAKVTTFEPSEAYSEIVKTIIHHKNISSITWVNSRYNIEQRLPLTNYNIGLVLSTYQWMAEGGKNLDYAVQALNDISKKVEYLFFELGYNQGKSHLKTDRINHYAFLIQYLRNHTQYNFFKLIGKTKLWKNNSRYLVLCSNDKTFKDSFFRNALSRIII